MRILADSLSLPNTIGKGPTITTAPPRALSFPRRDEDARTAIAARAIPASMSTIPMETRFWSGNGEILQLKSGSESYFSSALNKVRRVCARYFRFESMITTWT